MATEHFNDARAFRDFLDTKLSNGADALSLDEALVLWEYETLPNKEHAASVQAVKEALDDMRAGDFGTPVDGFVEELRLKYNLAELP
jgi:hypothetical protein